MLLKQRQLAAWLGREPGIVYILNNGGMRYAPNSAYAKTVALLCYLFMWDQPRSNPFALTGDY